MVILPPWAPVEAKIYATFNTTHTVLSYLFEALIVVHVIAACQARRASKRTLEPHVAGAPLMRLGPHKDLARVLSADH